MVRKCHLTFVYTKGPIREQEIKLEYMNSKQITSVAYFTKCSSNISNCWTALEVDIDLKVCIIRNHRSSLQGDFDITCTRLPHDLRIGSRSTVRLVQIVNAKISNLNKKEKKTFLLYFRPLWWIFLQEQMKLSWDFQG